MSTLITELRNKGYEVSFQDGVYDPYTLKITKDDKTIKIETHHYKNTKEAMDDIERIFNATKVQCKYKNKFRVKINNIDSIQKLGELYGGYLEVDARLLEKEYWYYTNVGKKTISQSVLLELIE